MLARNKLRKIFYKHRREFEKEFLKGANSTIFEDTAHESAVQTLDIFRKNDSETKDNLSKCTDVRLMEFQTEVENSLKNEIKSKESIKDYKNLDIFHRAVWPVLFLGQCFSIMPVINIRQYDPHRVRFNVKSVQMFITALYLIANTLFVSTMVKHLSKLGLNAKNLVHIVFFATVQLACILFLRLARKWPSIIQYWTRVEFIFVRPPYEELKRNLKRRIRFAAFLLLFLSVVEHILYLSSAILSFRKRIYICAKSSNSSANASFDSFILNNYDYIFQIFTFHRVVGVFILVVNLVCTFIWNYMDVFIMIISQGIAYRFEQIAMRINKIADKDVREDVFVEIREHYVKVCELLEMVDNCLSSIILLSCINNLYFVCNQLLNIFNKLRWPINYIYFWYSLSFLIGRTAVVFLTAASINDKATSALSMLRSVSNRSWCIEVERLIFQMSTQIVALSGKKFYFLTRRLLFGMAGTIVTYELVLLQFDEPNRSKGLPPLCG